MDYFRKILIFVFLFIPLFVFSQKISGYSINSGSYIFNSNIQIDYSIGQFSTSFINGKKSLFSNIFFSNTPDSLKKNYQNNDFILKLYPNPVKNYANLIITSEFEIKNIDVFVFDMHGHKLQVLSDIYYSDNFIKVKLNTSNLQNSNYIISIKINNSVFKNIKILKK